MAARNNHEKIRLIQRLLRSRPAPDLPRKGRNSMHKSKTEYEAGSITEEECT